MLMLMVVVHRITFLTMLCENKNLLLNDKESDVYCFQWQFALAIHSSIFRSLGRQKKTQLQWQTLQWQFRVINHSGRGERRAEVGSAHTDVSELTNSCYRKWIPLWPIIGIMLYISQPDLTLESSAGLVAGPTGKKKHISMSFKVEEAQ